MNYWNIYGLFRRKSCLIILQLLILVHLKNNFFIVSTKVYTYYQLVFYKFLLSDIIFSIHFVNKQVLVYSEAAMDNANSILHALSAMLYMPWFICYTLSAMLYLLWFILYASSAMLHLLSFNCYAFSAMLYLLCVICYALSDMLYLICFIWYALSAMLYLLYLICYALYAMLYFLCFICYALSWILKVFNFLTAHEQTNGLSDMVTSWAAHRS